MTLDDLEILLASHGADRQHWPEEVGAEVDALCAGSPLAVRLIRQAEALDRMLDSYQTEAPSAALRATVMAAARDKDNTAGIVPFPVARRGYSLARSLLPQVAALVAATFVGVWIGVNAFTVPMFSEEDYSSYVLGDTSDLVASLAGEQP